MSEAYTLVIVLTAIYLAECAIWVRKGALAFRLTGLRSWRLALPSSLWGNSRGGLVFTNPLPPLGAAIIAQPWPISISPTGIYGYTAAAIGDEGRAEQSEKFFRFEEIEQVTTEETELKINGQRFIKTISPQYAKDLAALITKIKSLANEKRASAIKSAIAESLDSKAAEKQIKKFYDQSAGLRLLSNLLFLFGFLIAPALAWRFGLEHIWHWLLGGLLANMFLITIEYFIIHRALYPELRETRYTRAFMIAISPPVGMRVYDLLTRQLSGSFHPLVIARAICQEEELKEFAGKVLRDIHYPLQPICPATEVAPRETEEWFRTRLREAIELSLKQAKIDIAGLLKAPERDSDQSIGYCPRCHSQFNQYPGECPTCGGIKLSPFVEKKEQAKASK